VLTTHVRRIRVVEPGARRPFNEKISEFLDAEPARANSAIYGLSTFLSSRKVAEDLSDRRRVEEMECQVRELIEQIAANRRQFAELVERTRPE
jgi:hypothetical protein